MFEEFEEYQRKLEELYSEWNQHLEVVEGNSKKRRLNKQYNQLINDLIICYKTGKYNRIPRNI